MATLWGILPEQDGKEAAGGGQADAFGLGGGGELGLFVGTETGLDDARLDAFVVNGDAATA